METQKNQSETVIVGYVPGHIKQWRNNQQTIIAKPHKLSEKGEAYQVSGVMTIIRGSAAIQPSAFNMSDAFLECEC